VPSRFYGKRASEVFDSFKLLQIQPLVGEMINGEWDDLGDADREAKYLPQFRLLY